MATTAHIGAAVALFIVAAFLWYQSRALEGFADIPTDLNQAPRSAATQVIPSAPQKNRDIPSVASGLRDAPASRHDLGELNELILYWLSAASQQASERPGSLTSDQLRRQTTLQGRLVSVRTQLGIGLITDTQAQVTQEITELRRENAGWQMPSPNMEDVRDFAKGVSENSYLTPALYSEFKQLLEIAIRQLTEYPQPDPLQQLRLQQLQVTLGDLGRMETGEKIPDIRVQAARQFLNQILRYDQPLPSLYELHKTPATIIIQAPAPNLQEDPADVLRDLKTMTGATGPVVRGLQSGAISAQELPRIRAEIVDFKNQQSLPGVDEADVMAAYNPADYVKRARTLCGQIREAFPGDDQALGCPRRDKEMSDTEARSVVHNVCSRLRDSVPTVSPEQFNCPIYRK